MGKNETKIALAIHILLADVWTKEDISRNPHKFKQTPFTLNETNSNIMNEQIAHCSIFHKLYFNQWDFHAPKVSPSRTSLGLPCADVHWSSWDRHSISHETSSNISSSLSCSIDVIMLMLWKNWQTTGKALFFPCVVWESGSVKCSFPIIFKQMAHKSQ